MAPQYAPPPVAGVWRSRRLPPLLAALALLATIAQAQLPEGEFATRLQAAERKPIMEACSAIEQLLQAPLTMQQRGRCFKTLRSYLRQAAPPPLSAAEQKLVDDVESSAAPTDTLLLGHYTITLATQRFAEQARQCDWTVALDLAYVVLRDYFAVDPVADAGHRYVIFPAKDKPDGFTTDGRHLRIWTGRHEQEQGTQVYAYVHEMSHAFVDRHPARLLFQKGFGEGWTELSKAIVAAELDVCGPPFNNDLQHFIKRFRDAGRDEYLETRLPIEDIIGYDPSSSLLLELVLTTHDADQRLDWRPLLRLLRTARSDGVPRYLWPAWMAHEFTRCFDGYDVRPVLEEYRFPTDPTSQAEVERWINDRKPPDNDAYIVRDWRVLGPIPDPHERGIDCDPLDVENFVVQDTYEIDGQTYRWRTDVPVNKRGVVQLGKLDNTDRRCVFYLLARWPAERPQPTTCYISSDDEAAVWLDGQRIYTFRGNRGTDPGNPDRAYGQFAPAGGQILVMVANYGGPCGFHLRASPDNPFATGFRDVLKTGDTDRRLAMVNYLGSRPVPHALVAPQLTDALADADESVRKAAIHALAGRRNDVHIVDALLARWQTEPSEAVGYAFRPAFEELTFERPSDCAAATKWWHNHRAAFERTCVVECEDSFHLIAMNGGARSANGRAYGGQCVGRVWGKDPGDRLELVLTAHTPGPHTLALRYACAERPGSVRMRLRRGTQIVHEIDRVELPETPTFVAWRWVQMPIPDLKPGRYVVEFSNSTSSPDLDAVALRPAKEPD